MLTDYQVLSNESKVWIYPSSRKFYKEEIEELEEKIKQFIEGWKKDDENFKSSYQFLYNRFIIIAAEDENTSISSQDIDALVGFILELQNHYKIELLDRMNVCFKQGEYVQYKELKDFKKLLKNKSVSEKTIVFDNLIQSKEELEHFWEVPIAESWYNRFL
ncbi:MAG: ABC transporter ATPase [Flavobacteriaceae bacterium]